MTKPETPSKDELKTFAKQHVRCKGWKNDEDLLDEYFYIEHRLKNWSYGEMHRGLWVGLWLQQDAREHLKKIEAELGEQLILIARARRTQQVLDQQSWFRRAFYGTK